MKSTIILTLGLFIIYCNLSDEVHLSEKDLIRMLSHTDQYSKRRWKRQALANPQMFPVLNGVLKVPIPTNIGHFPGGNQKLDSCDRDEIMMEDGTCEQLITNGKCGTQEQILVDSKTNRGFCAPRLCPPDRVFVHSTQLCHDPLDTTICPAGRELFYSSYGTSVCACPDGTIEGDDDLDDDVCELVLGKSLLCPPGQVFWFKDFNNAPQCLPDPCNGLNLKKGPNELPFVPSKRTGKCFQIGSSNGVCPSGLYYSLSLNALQGECSTLEDAGYIIYDPKQLETLMQIYGDTLPKHSSGSAFTSQTSTPNSNGSVQFLNLNQQNQNMRYVNDQQSVSNGNVTNDANKSTYTSIQPQGSHPNNNNNYYYANMYQDNTNQHSIEVIRQTGQFNSPEVFGQTGASPNNQMSLEMYSHNNNNNGRSLNFQPSFELVPARLTQRITILPSGRRITHSTNNIPRHIRSIKNKETFRKLLKHFDTKLSNKSQQLSKVLSRKKRQTLAYASPSTVFETRLLGCRPGAVRDINAKCRETILPARVPKVRGIRAAPPIPPTPSCPSGMAFNIRRQCVPSTTAQNNLLALNLG